VALVRTYVSEEPIFSIIMAKRISELGRALAVTKPKHISCVQEPQDVISQKTAFFIVTAVKNSYL
jgi:hypothetical protein